MKNRSKLVINQETMVQAIEFWLNNSVFEYQHMCKVIEVSINNEDDIPQRFDILMDEIRKEKSNAA